MTDPAARTGQSDRHFADVVVLAAGTSQRMGHTDKLFLEVGGLPLVGWTVAAVARSESVRRVIVVTRADMVAPLREAPWIREAGAVVVAGGARRQESVAKGVAATSSEVVLIHDGARALLTPALVDRVARATAERGLVVPVVPVPESMLVIREGRVSGELDKTDLFKSQTPHGVRRELLLAAYAECDPHGPEMFIDEASVVAATTGTPMATVAGEAVNLKVTTPGDDELTVALLEARARAVVESASVA